MNQFHVVLAWVTTGHVCDANGMRILNQSITPLEFENRQLANVFCQEVLHRRPFLECHIYSPNGNHLETLHDETGWNHPYQIESNGKFRVRLTEWLSRAHVSESGDYLAANELLPLIEFETYLQAKRYCKETRTHSPVIAPWIYGPDGDIIFCATSDVSIDETGKRLVYLPWWISMWRNLKMVVG